MSEPSLNDQVNIELDTRKIRQAVDAGKISLDEIASAPVVMVCECGLEQSIKNDSCERCGRSLV
jgi:hypothetical protein